MLFLAPCDFAGTLHTACLSGDDLDLQKMQNIGTSSWRTKGMEQWPGQVNISVFIGRTRQSACRYWQSPTTSLGDLTFVCVLET